MELALAFTVASGAIRLGMDLYEFIAKQRAELQRTGEWTAEDERKWDELLAQRATAPWQQPE